MDSFRDKENMDPQLAVEERCDGGSGSVAAKRSREPLAEITSRFQGGGSAEGPSGGGGAYAAAAPEHGYGRWDSARGPAAPAPATCAGGGRVAVRMMR